MKIHRSDASMRNILRSVARIRAPIMNTAMSTRENTIVAPSMPQSPRILTNIPAEPHRTPDNTAIIR